MERVLMNNQATFFLTPAVLDTYKKLKFHKDARPYWNVLPFGTLFWGDEHPLLENGLPDLPTDKWSRASILRLVEARTALWIEGEVPKSLQRCWKEAQTALPDWPGFQRMVLADEERVDLLCFQEDIFALEDEVLSKAVKVSQYIDETGLPHISATFRTKKSCKFGDEKE